VIAAQPLRWAVLITNLDPVRGHEQGGTRRVLVVSYEAFHRSASMTVCPITAARGVARYPHEVALPVGEAGQTRPGVILCHQVRTISLLRVPGAPSPVGFLSDPSLREQVRVALAGHLGLDIPARLDGATGTRTFKP
jgi:mRNA interferase MazF